MIFVVVIGGLGTIEGPILSAIVYHLLRENLADLGNWSLVIVGVVAITITLLAPKGLWGLTRRRMLLFPTGYRMGPSG
jgi:branched-chain amino acid transport system permease protein